MWSKMYKKNRNVSFEEINHVVEDSLHKLLLNMSNQKEDHPFITQFKSATVQLVSEIRQELAKTNQTSRSTPSPLKDIVKQYINQSVEFNTPAGIVEGIITEVGDDYVEIQESEDIMVIVRLANAISFQPR